MIEGVEKLGNFTFSFLKFNILIVFVIKLLHYFSLKYFWFYNPLFFCHKIYKHPPINTQTKEFISQNKSKTEDVLFILLDKKEQHRAREKKRNNF